MGHYEAPIECGDGRVGGPLWYAAHTRHQHEKVVASMLANKGFEVFLPLYSEIRQWRDRLKKVELPLFSCYVFLRGDLDRRLAILSTPGVHGMVTSAGKLAGIPEEEIEAVRSVIANRIKVKPHPFLKVGDLVRVKCGALSGLEGFLVRRKGQTRLILSVALLERSVAAEIDASAVEPVMAPQEKTVTRFGSREDMVPSAWGWGRENATPEPVRTLSTQ